MLSRTTGRVVVLSKLGWDVGMAKLSRQEVDSLCSFVDERIRQQGCDHTHRFSREWAALKSFGWDELLDLLEQYGGHCDCEVFLNLPEEIEVEWVETATEPTRPNLWRLPVNFNASSDDNFNLLIFCDAKLGRNTHALDGEILVPAPRGAKPRKGIRKSVHFFLGCSSGMPAEVGVVAECDGVSAEVFARRVADSGIEELSSFTYREASFVLSKISALKPGMPVGTNFMSVFGASQAHEELRIHRVVICD